MAYNLRSRTIRDTLIEDDDVIESFGGESSDIEEDNIEEQSEDSDYEELSDNDDELENALLSSRLLQSAARGRPTSLLRGKNGYVWTMKPRNRTSDRFQHDEESPTPGAKNEASDLKTVEEFWDMLFNQEIIDIIVEQTNGKIEDYCAQLIANNLNIQSYHYHTDVLEIKAFIGILYYSGLWKSSNVDDKMLWDKKNGITLYRCVMPYKRFRLLSTCLRFDKKGDRDASDKFAPIRKIWNIFIGNCIKYYEPSKRCTVDEQLLSFRGRCGFRMYIKSKPDKYGLKIVTLNDADTSYLIYGIPYLGKERNKPSNTSGNIAQRVFTEVTAPIHGTNRTVACDNWFTSIPLIEEMMKPPYNLTITGTIRKNKREIPAEMTVASKTPPETKFCFSKNNDITLLSFTPKKNKIVLVASSYSSSTTITNGKPEIILHYNKTKGGTDCFDQLCHARTTTRRTQRWPIRIFFGMLDQAAVNARILHKCKMISMNQNRSLTSAECLEKIYQHLIMPFLRERQLCPTIRTDIKTGIAAILKKDLPQQSPERIYLQKRKRCMLCESKKDKKTKEVCSSCERAMCDDHRAFFCTDCIGE